MNSPLPQRVLELLADEQPLSVAQLRLAVNSDTDALVSDSRLSRTLTAMVAEGRIVRVKRGYYQLPAPEADDERRAVEPVEAQRRAVEPVEAQRRAVEPVEAQRRAVERAATDESGQGRSGEPAIPRQADGGRVPAGQPVTTTQNVSGAASRTVVALATVPRTSVPAPRRTEEGTPTPGRAHAAVARPTPAPVIRRKPASLIDYVAALLWFVATGLALIFFGDAAGVGTGVVAFIGLCVYYRIRARRRAIEARATAVAAR